MRFICLIAAMTLIPARGQVKPTAGALTPSNVAAAPAPGTASIGSVPKGAPSSQMFKQLESRFDYNLKTADKDSPIDVLGYTRGVYLQGYGAVFSTEVELVQNNILPMFHTGAVTAEEKSRIHNRKVQHLDLLRKQMREMLTTAAKSLDLGPSDQVVVAVRLAYQNWEDRSGLPDQIVMKADRRGAESGDIKVDAQ